MQDTEVWQIFIWTQIFLNCWWDTAEKFILNHLEEKRKIYKNHFKLHNQGVLLIFITAKQI